MSVARICKQNFRLLRGTFLTLTLSFQFWLVVHYDLSACSVNRRDYSYHAHSKPYTRVPAHLVGMARFYERFVSDPA